jgi:hypothetical protein
LAGPQTSTKSPAIHRPFSTFSLQPSAYFFQIITERWKEYNVFVHPKTPKVFPEFVAKSLNIRLKLFKSIHVHAERIGTSRRHPEKAIG